MIILALIAGLARHTSTSGRMLREMLGNAVYIFTDVAILRDSVGYRAASP